MSSSRKRRRPSIGLDVGSVHLHAALLDGGVAPRLAFSRPIKGSPQKAVIEALGEIQPLVEEERLTVGVTGVGRELLRKIPGVRLTNEITASALGAARLAPGARCLVEVGGHFSKWVALDDEGEIQDYSINELCAAGSGAFLEQQSSRLSLPVTELASLAAAAPAGATIAGRCSVFAKSDMIHLQQKGTPLDEIAYGLCLALARNFAATVLKGRELSPPVALIGGCAANQGLVRALREVLSLKGKDLVVPKTHNVFGAVGAAASAAEDKPSLTVKDLVRRVTRSMAAGSGSRAALEPLVEPKHPGPGIESVPGVKKERDVFLGVDVGSVSTDFVLIAEDGEVLDGVYLPTRGRPITVMEEGLAALREKTGGRARVLAVGTTGSGRHLAAKFLQADVVRNEITAQLKSSAHYFPKVDTIFEIGGQDSKFISAKDGAIDDFAMNKICAAGTGSFLEEQAVRLGLSIIGEFEEHALRGEAPADLGTRCTVFMDTELVHALQRGVPVEDVAAGLAYSITRNYLDKVVAGGPVGKNVVFQGGVASNRAVVAAFSQLLGKDIRVHPFNRLSGAIGAALIAREAHRKGGLKTRFVGFDGCGDYKMTSFECKHCSNMCQVSRIERGGEKAFFGDVCERYTSGVAGGKRKGEFPDLFTEREKILKECVERGGRGSLEPTTVEWLLGRYAPRVLGTEEPGTRKKEKKARTIGIPRASHYFELFPLWAVFLKELGFDVVLSGPSSKELLAKGGRKFSTDACLPVKLSYSHSVDVTEKKPDYLFLPSILDLPAPFGSPELCSTCPYTQSLPYMVRSSMSGRFLVPQVNMSTEIDGLPEGLESLVEDLGVDARRLRAAYQAGKDAYLEFKEELLGRGREVMDSDFPWAAVLIGKPYNIYDPFLNLNLVRHLGQMGVPAIPYEFIPRVRAQRLKGSWDTVPWRFNRDYIKAALAACEDKRLFPLVISNFGCGPDGFTVKHLERILEGKPALFLEFDEHRGEAGLVTRLEAFADEVEAHRRQGARAATPKALRQRVRRTRPGRKFYLPYIAEHVHAYAGALKYAGHDTEILPLPDEDVLRKGERYSSGRECHPYSILAGDLVRLAESRKEGDPPAAFFFFGSTLPCLITQYGPGHRLILDQLGADKIDVVTPTTQDFRELIGIQGGVRLWRGLVVMDMLVKLSCELRPYELRRGSVDSIHLANCLDLERAVAGGDVVKTARDCVERLVSVPIDTEAWKARVRPVVGVAGDIYTRSNRFANKDLFSTLEGMGCEVWPAPFVVDIFDFGLRRAFESSVYRRDLSGALQQGSMLALKEMSEQGIRRLFKDRSRFADEPSYREIVEVAGPYVGERSSLIVMLNIAKMVHFADKGADGIINAMCFNCMVGAVTASITAKLRANHDNVPMVNMVFGGTEGSSQLLRLEAFVHQVKSYGRRRKRPSVPPRTKPSLFSPM